MLKKPKAVIINDVHYNLNTLSLADASVNSAMRKAEELNVPLVVAGDLHDTKAAMRGECINAMIKTFSVGKCRKVVIPGNHCRLNEKGKEHSLEFLRPYAEVIDDIKFDEGVDAWLVPYQSNTSELEKLLSNEATHGNIVIMHQGVMGANMGHYTQDKTSLPPQTFANHRVISGHYHCRQDIKCGRPRKGAVGLFSYTGNPYTLSFGEAGDPPKGYSILNSDGSITPVPLKLRKHVVMELEVDCSDWHMPYYTDNDIVWVKLRGSQLELDKIKKKDVGTRLGLTNFKLDKIPTDRLKADIQEVDRLTGDQILDTIIDSTDDKAADKKALKALWREILQ